MLTFKKLTSIKGKTILYFFSAVSIVSLLMGGITYLFLIRNYDNAIERHNKILIQQIASYLDQKFFSPALYTFTELIGNERLYPSVTSFSNDPELNKHIKLNAVYTSLKNVSYSNSGIIQSIDIYYRKPNLTVSSGTGLTYLNSEDETLAWWEPPEKRTGNAWWRKIGMNPREDDTLVFFSAFPQNASYSNTRGVVAVQLRMSAIRDILSSYETADTGYYLISRDSEVVYGDSAELDARLSRTHLLKELEQNSGDSFIFRADGDSSYIISCAPSRFSTYLILSVTSMKTFYRDSATLQLTFTFTVLGVLLIGLVLARIFSHKLYKPLKQIVSSDEGWGAFFPPSEKGFQDEYAYIRFTLDRLNAANQQYEKAFGDNKKTMQYGFIQALLNGSLSDSRVISESLEFLDMRLNGPCFRVACLFLRPPRSGSIHEPKTEFMIYQLISYLEKLSEVSGIAFYGVKTFDYSVTVLCSYTSEKEAALYSALTAFNLYCRDHLKTHCSLCISSDCPSPSAIGRLHQELMELKPYLFLLSGRKYLLREEINALNGDSQEIPFELIDDFQKNLNDRQLGALEVRTAELISLCTSGNYTYDHCNQRLLSLMYVLSKYLKSLNLFTPELTHDELNRQFLYSNTIEELGQWLLNVIRNSFSLLENRCAYRSLPVMDQIMTYIRQNLSAALSLEQTAEAFQISPNYLGRIFREETGTSFVDYVTALKLDKSVELLVNTALTIDEIAFSAGFNSSAYYIKRFKEKYGVTPKAYRINRKLAF